MAKDKDLERLKRDATAFGISVVGHVPHIGKVIGIYDTAQKGEKLAKSTRRYIDAKKRRARTNMRRGLRKFQRYL